MNTLSTIKTNAGTSNATGGVPRRPFTHAEDLVIARMRNEGKPFREIAEALGRKEGSVSARMLKVGDSPQPKKHRNPNAEERPCMCCKKTFLSAGSHNRRCRSCREISATPFDYLP